MNFYNLTLRDFDATPNNVVLPDALAWIVTREIPSRTVYLVAELPVGTGGGTGSEVYPPVGKVRSAEKYGPTGVEYTGVETLPLESQVAVGVGYGANGTEFTGSLVGGTSTKRRVRSVM